MVDRYTLTALDDVATRFGAPPPAGSVPRFNIAPLQQAPIFTADGLATARWGLLPPWRGHGGKRAPHVKHAFVAIVDETPLLRNAFKKQRCLVLADGFYYWQELEKRTQPLWLHLPRDEHRPEQGSQLIGLAGIAATHRDDGQLSFALLEGPMRVTAGDSFWIDGPIMIDHADIATWLTGSVAAAHALLAPRPVAWRAEPVSSYVNAIDHDDARCIASLRNPLQGELF